LGSVASQALLANPLLQNFLNISSGPKRTAFLGMIALAFYASFFFMGRKTFWLPFPAPPFPKNPEKIA